MSADKQSSRVLLVWLAMLIFAAATSVVRRLTLLGAEHGGSGDNNPISLCNVLFIGNACAFAYLILIFRKEWTREALREISRGDWIRLLGVAVLSGALAPALTFSALESTSVANVVLLGRLEPPLLLLLSAIMLRDRPDRWSVLGSALALLGVALTVVLGGGASVMLGSGELQAMGGAAVLAVSTVLGKHSLTRVPLGLFTCVRTGAGAVVFFIAATALYGPEHFSEAFSPFLWQWMLLYALVIVVGGQLAWFAGLKGSSAADVSLATSFTPVAGLAFAKLLLGEGLGIPQAVGAAVIFFGIVVAQVGRRQTAKDADTSLKKPNPRSETPSAEGQVGFTGA